MIIAVKRAVKGVHEKVIKPWATPTDTMCGSDWALPQQVTWFLLERKESNHFCAVSFTPKRDSLRDRME